MIVKTQPTPLDHLLYSFIWLL